MYFSKATWKGPSPNRYSGGMETVFGLVLHIMAGAPNGSRGPGPQLVDGQELPVTDDLPGCSSEFMDSASQVSAHFGTGLSGQLWQWVDTADAAWAEVAGNQNWISIENSGACDPVGGADLLLPSQIDSCAEVFAWLHQEYGIPLQLTNDPSVPGLGYHAMGGVDWGNHPCPCTPIIEVSRPLVLAKAKEILGQGTGDDVQLPVYKLGQQGRGICSVQGALNSHVASGVIQGVAQVKEDGIFGQDTLDLLHAWMKVADPPYGPFDFIHTDTFTSLFPPPNPMG